MRFVPHRILRAVTVKIKYHDFIQITRSRTLPDKLSIDNTGKELLLKLLKDTEAGLRPVRLLGVTLSSLTEPSAQPHNPKTDLFLNGTG